jgi:hypothetical protein
LIQSSDFKFRFLAHDSVEFVESVKYNKTLPLRVLTAKVLEMFSGSGCGVCEPGASENWELEIGGMKDPGGS